MYDISGNSVAEDSRKLKTVNSRKSVDTQRNEILISREAGFVIGSCMKGTNSSDDWRTARWICLFWRLDLGKF